jgi:hypothetical protein
VTDLAGLQNAKTDRLDIAVERLIEMLQQQRQAMLQADPAAVSEIESATRKVAQALAALAALTGGARQRPAPRQAIENSAVERLRETLLASQQVQAMFAAGNRRALDALFGAPDLYSR